MKFRGFFVKTAISGKITKFAELKKKGTRAESGWPECAQERDLEGAAHPGPWPGSVEAASRQGKRAGWICEGRLVLGLGQLTKRRRPKGAEARSTAGERSGRAALLVLKNRNSSSPMAMQKTAAAGLGRALR